MSRKDVSNGFSIVERQVPTLYFVGVTTSQSSIMKVFPRWMNVLGRPQVVIEGIDHDLHDEVDAYRGTVAQIKYDGNSLGALVTSHKIDILEAAGDMFDVLHESVELTGELSCISKGDGQLMGHAKDPLTSGLSLDAVLGRGYFDRTGGHVLIIGAGGSGKAISLHLIRKREKADQPGKVIVVNRSQGRLDQLREMVNIQETDIVFDYLLNEDPSVNDEIMSKLPRGSIVINATGLGKDRPGSPVTNRGLFPRGGIVWEINYRGELDFWHQAMAQRESRELTVEDGWLYFLHGWTQHIAEVLHLQILPEMFDRLAKEAEGLRPLLVPKLPPQ